MNDLKRVREKAKKPQSYEEAHPILHPLYDLIAPLLTNKVFWFFFGILLVILAAEMILEIFRI